MRSPCSPFKGLEPIYVKGHCRNPNGISKFNGTCGLNWPGSLEIVGESLLPTSSPLPLPLPLPVAHPLAGVPLVVLLGAIVQVEGADAPPVTAPVVDLPLDGLS